MLMRRGCFVAPPRYKMASPIFNLSDVEVEAVDDETFELLGHATELGTLEYELEEVKQTLAIRKNQGSYVPLELFRSSRSVTVSGISSGLWCEQQVEYRHLHPYLRRSGEWSRRSAEGMPVQRRTEVMKEGASIHLRKELETTHEMVEVETITKEDKYAVELLNTYIKLKSIKNGNIEREIRINGYPFDHMTLATGIIDQLQYCSDEGMLFLLELKTRKARSLPGIEQKRGNALQLMLYRNMLDSLTQGRTNHCEFLDVMCLKSSMPLSFSVSEYINESGLTDQIITNPQHPHITTLGQLANSISVLITGLELPPVGSLLVQYEHQFSGDVLGVESVLFDGEWARKEVGLSLQYWLGERDAIGVDIEESWKCGSCQFKDVCVWRKKQILERSPVKKWPQVFTDQLSTNVP